MNLDYSLLTLPLSLKDRREASEWREGNGFSNRGVYVLRLFMGTALAYVLVRCSLYIFGVDIALDDGLTIACLIGLPILWVVKCGFERAMLRQERLYLFARANGARYMLNAWHYDSPGLIFDEGRDGTLDEGFKFEDGLEIGNYRYTTGDARHPQTHKWSFVSIPLARKMPHLVLDARGNNLFGLSNLPDSFGGQKISLEGSFNDHFTAYAPDGYGTDALYILTPDVMVEILDSGKKYDIEIVDDRMYLYAQRHIKMHSPQEIERIMRIVSLLGDEVRHQNQSYRDDRVEAGSDDIHASGRRLRHSLSLAEILVIVIAILYVLLTMIAS